MENEESLYYLIGETLAYTQCIEHDIKEIYAKLLKGDRKVNLKQIEDEKWTISKTVLELEILDNSDKKPIIDTDSYNILKRITGERNYIVNNCFKDYTYISDENMCKKKFNSICNRIQLFHDKLSKLYIKLSKLNTSLK